MISAEVPNALRDIALSIENAEEFCSQSVEQSLSYLKDGNSQSSQKFRDFLAKHGHRGYKEFDPLVHQWADNPIPVINSLRSMLMNGSSHLIPKEEKSLNQIVSSIKTPLSATKRFILKKFILPRCRDGVGMSLINTHKSVKIPISILLISGLREQGKYLWIWTLNVFRHAFWRLSEMMVSEGRLPENDLLFYLSIHELQKLVNERDSALVLRAKWRKRLHNKKDKLIFSETVIGPIMTPRNVSLDLLYCSTFALIISYYLKDNTVLHFLNIDGSNKIKGTPISFGKVKARVCVAMNLDEAQNIQVLKIL